MSENKAAELEAQLLATYAGSLLVDELAGELNMEAPALDRPILDTALDRIRQDQQRRQKRRDRRVFAFRLAATSCAALLVVFTVAFVTVDAFRIEFMNLFVRSEKQYFSYAAQADLKEAGFVHAPAYIPEEYTDSHIIATPDLKQLILVGNDSDMVVYFEQHSDISTVFLDAETNVETVKIKGIYDGTLLTGKGTVVFWEQGGYFYKIDGAELDRVEAVKMAESLQRL